MAIVTCPNCHRRYDPGVDDLQEDMPDNLSLKVVCPACGQWLRLPEREAIDPPDVPADILREMSSQSRLVGEEEAPSERRRRDDEERPRRRESRDRDYEDEDRPRRRWRDDNYEDDEYEDRPRRRHYEDERDDFDDYPRRKPADGLGIASMVIGIGSCVMSLGGLCCIFFTGISVLGGILAVILGFVARSQTRVASGPAKTGIITGFIAIVLAVLLVAVMIAIQFGGGIGN